MKQSAAIYPDVQEDRKLRQAKASLLRVFPPIELDQVLQQYQVTAHQVPEVVKFLLQHRFLLPVLTEATVYLKQIFGQSLVYLEVERDPDEGFTELFGVVVVRKSPEEALALLECFDRLWFTEIAEKTRLKLNFTVDTINNESV